MKNFIVSLCMLISAQLLAQPSASYYNSATGSGYTLKSQLHDIIDGHSNRGYSAVWDFIYDYELDAYYENDGTVLDIYSENPSGSDPYNFSKGSDQCGNYSGEGSCYNREHSFPKSWFNDGQPMYNDVHHLFPTDGYVNGQRGNFPFGEVGSSVDYQSDNGSLKGSARSGLGYSGTVFEPIDEFKGDLARAYFYMATRYEDVLSSWSSAMLDGSTDQVYTDWALEMLMDWHANDPVSQKEIDRNNNAETFQGNRNPFVDHPEWVNAIWGDGSALPVLTTSRSSIDFGEVTSGDNSPSESYTLTGTDLQGNVTVTTMAPFELSIDNSSWSTSLNVSQSSAESTSTVYVRFSPSSSSSQSHSATITHSSTAATQVSISLSGIESVDGDPAPVSSGGSVFISEYLEGSGNNKALEIFNGTNQTIDLTSENYYIERYNNGATSSTGAISLSGSLPSGEVLVIGNPGAESQTIQDESDEKDEITFFNGDDAIALYKNGVLIDMIGIIGTDPGSSWSSGDHSTSDKTLVRKASVRKGNTAGFDPISNLTSEWDVYDIDYVSDLGSHTFTPISMTFTWDGSSSAWSSASNWDQGLTPLSIDDIIIPNTTQLPTISSDVAINDLEIQTGATLNITSGAALLINGDFGGSGAVSASRNIADDFGYSIIGSPFESSLLTELQADLIYDYDGFTFSSPSGPMSAGKGFFVAYDEAQPQVSLSGTPNTGDVFIDLSGDGDKFNAVANPYLAPISRSAFLFENANAIDGNIYFWDDGGSNAGNLRGGDYVVVNDMGQTSLTPFDDNISGDKGENAFDGNMGSFQGFLVKAYSASQLVFKPSMQVSEAGSNGDAHFYRGTTTEQKEIYRLSVSGNSFYNEAIIGFATSATLDKDFALDAERFAANKSLSLYSIQEDYQYVIQALPFENSTSVRLSFNAETPGNYELSLSTENEQQVTLIDKQSNRTHDLTANPTYQFYSEQVENDQRFRVVFGSTITNTELEDGITPSVYQAGLNLTILAKLEGLQDVTLYTIDGRVVFSGKVDFLDGKGEIKLPKGKGIYILTIADLKVKFLKK